MLNVAKSTKPIDCPMTTSETEFKAKRVECRGLLHTDALEFRRKYNVEAFQFRHDLATTGIFSLSRLSQVAERMLARGDLKKFVVLGGKFSLANAKFHAMPAQERLVETIRHLEDANVWLKLTSVNTADSDFQEVMQAALREIEQLSGLPLRKEITWAGLTMFLASPRVTTPFHIDHESNFLFQVQGEKDVSLFDPSDRALVPIDQIERFYAGDFEAAQYREEMQNRGKVFRLTPGTVVHQPPLAPHWVQNGDNVSVSVSIGFCLRSLDRRARIHQVNHFLRRFGLPPSPPDQSRTRDAVKMACIGMVSKRNPSTPDEILFSGLSRLAAPPRAIKRLVRHFRSPIGQ